jgi:hypothetical protein
MFHHFPSKDPRLSTWLNKRIFEMAGLPTNRPTAVAKTPPECTFNAGKAVRNSARGERKTQ